MPPFALAPLFASVFAVWPARLSVRAASALGLALLGVPSLAAAQTSEEAVELPRIRITDPNRELFRLALPNVAGDRGLATEALEIQRHALDIVGLFNLLDPRSFPAGLQQEGMGFSSALWTTVGAQGVAKVSVERKGRRVALEGRLYQVGRGESPVLSKAYESPDLRDAVHAWVNDVIGQFTGQPGIFGSRIAYSIYGHRGEIGSVGADGSEARTLTKMRSDCLMPAFSPSGDRIVFTSYLRGTPDLWVVPASGGRARILSRKQGMNSGASWTPDGRDIILTLSFEGNAELYRISGRNGKVEARLTRSPFIDMSASMSPDGTQIAFVSDRGGTAQIYVMAKNGGASRRITFQGNNNTTPRWNPDPQKPLIAFTGRDEKGRFDVFVYDLKTKKIERVTQNQGSNQSPDWSPDGRLLVYSSSRGGLFVANPLTGKETQIYRGRVNSPSWGPAPKAR